MALGPPVALLRVTRSLLAAAALVFVCCDATAQSPAPPPSTDPILYAWSETLKQWKKDGDSAALHLARGVLFDCVTHRRRVEVFFPPDHTAIAGNDACRSNLPLKCTEEAEKALGAALKLDPALTEARLRLAALRNERDPTQGITDLEAVFTAPGTPAEMRYLAAIFQGKGAWTRRDAASHEWFGRAASIDPRWIVARQLLEATSPSSQSVTLADFRSDSLDPWYAYRCGIFTESVRTELAARITRGSGK